MCHEYGMRWWRSEGREKKRTEETKPDLMGIFAIPEQGEPIVSPATTVEESKPAIEEKELAPAK